MPASRSRSLAANSPNAAATTRDPSSAPVTASPAMSSPAAAPVNDSSAVPCTAKDILRVTTNGPMIPEMSAISAHAISACCANGCWR